MFRSFAALSSKNGKSGGRDIEVWLCYWIVFFLLQNTVFKVLAVLPLSHVGDLLRTGAVVFLAMPRFGGTELVKEKCLKGAFAKLRNNMLKGVDKVKSSLFKPKSEVK